MKAALVVVALVLVLGAPADVLAKSGPIDAKVTLDAPRATTATVTAASGATLKSGLITITFPAGAVDQDTAVTATPVKRLKGRGLKPGLITGVQLQPEGLELMRAATVRLAGQGRVTFVGSLGSGEDVYRLPPALKRVHGKVKVKPSRSVAILHFSTVEGFDWSTATIRELDHILRPEVGIHALSQEVSRFLQEGRFDEAFEVIDRYRDRLITPLLSQAEASLATNCSEAGIRRAQNAIRTGLSFERQVDILGGQSGHHGAYATLISLQQKTAECLVKLCPTLGDPRVGPYLVDIARQLSLSGLGNAAYWDAVIENLIRCGTFELHLDSRIDHKFENDDYQLRVEGRLTYVPSVDGEPVKPRGPLHYLSATGTSPGECYTTEISGTHDGEFELAGFDFGAYDPDAPSRNPVINVQLAITQIPTEAYHQRSTPHQEQCNTEEPPDTDLPFWFAGFQSEHLGFQFPGADWVRDVAPVYAIAVYSPNTKVYENGSLSENTLVEIIHKPQPPVPLPNPGG